MNVSKGLPRVSGPCMRALARLLSSSSRRRLKCLWTLVTKGAFTFANHKNVRKNFTFKVLFVIVYCCFVDNNTNTRRSLACLARLRRLPVDLVVKMLLTVMGRTTMAMVRSLWTKEYTASTMTTLTTHDSLPCCTKLSIFCRSLFSPFVGWRRRRRWLLLS